MAISGWQLAVLAVGKSGRCLLSESQITQITRITRILRGFSLAQKAVSGLEVPTPNGDCSYWEDGRAKRRLDRERKGAGLRRGCNLLNSPKNQQP